MSGSITSYTSTQLFILLQARSEGLDKYLFIAISIFLKPMLSTNVLKAAYKLISASPSVKFIYS